MPPATKTKENDMAKTIKELTDRIERQDRLISILTETVDGLGDDIVSVSKAVQETKSVIGLTEIDPNLTFQKCLSSAIEGIATTRNIFTITRSESHLKEAVTAMVDLAEALQVELTERFGVEVK